MLSMRGGCMNRDWPLSQPPTPRTVCDALAYNTAMHSWLLQLVALGTSLVLALPPGWCGFFMHRGQAKCIPAEATCCRRPDPSRSSKAPVRPSVQCCCLQDAVLPQRPIAWDGAASVVLPVVADSLPLGGVSPTAAAAALEPLATGPPLHVLQCVWRC
jgi:hypothetical protein